jgi:hypothetical protein
LAFGAFFIDAEDELFRPVDGRRRSPRSNP